MQVRRLPAALPLVVLVSVVAHVANFGSEHAPGGSHAAALFAALGAALLFLGICGFFGSAFHAPGGSIATRPRTGYPPLLLAVGGLAAYAAIELCEGHFSCAGTLRATAALLPAAPAIAFLERIAGRAVRRAGHRFAAFCYRKRAAAAPFIRLHAAQAAALWNQVCGPSRRGRSPPRFA